MTTDHRAVLAKIKRFDQLVAYLRDEMGWPIARDSFEDEDEWFFDFTADELGIDPKTAAKIEEIKRLRPLVPQQPWGIFFVKFEPKKLPVVVLRRILSRVALKKRASANSAERTAWAADDLLFVSNYGEGDERQISFAHFSQAESKDDLPTLKVLGWNNLDTPLHLDDVAENLTRNLAWPVDDSDIDAWRKTWSAAFTLRHREVITTSRDLSVRLAQLARDIRDRIQSALAIETENGPLTKLMKAFQEALIHDLDADGFADMYAQTIAYGLLSARIANPAGRTADHLPLSIPVTNPFLKELMATFLHVGGRRGTSSEAAGIDFDELGVNEVVELLDDANMEAVVLDFGDKNPLEDPVIHFYELFLKEYDAKKRMQRGVFYTPRPVVSYIVRSVHELLQTEFGLTRGLADTATWGDMAERHDGLTIPECVKPTDCFVTVLDPATGTGTFLVEVMEVIHRTLVEEWEMAGHGEKEILDLWNDYVPAHLLPRLHGYELMMAPYAIAHLKIGLKLLETGYRFDSDERARIYLTNALEPAQDFSGQFDFAIPALAHEAQAVNEVKRNQRFTVVTGNPPYSGHSWNLSPELRKLVEPYRFVDGERIREKGALQLEKSIQDDYVKFIRLAELRITESGGGIVGFVTSHGFLDNPFLRGMRASIRSTFSRLFVLDLHGNGLRHETAPDGSADQNVFDIKRTGIAISLFRRLWTRAAPAVSHADMWGDRDTVKYPRLASETYSTAQIEHLLPKPPSYVLVPQDLVHADEYENGHSIGEAMPVHSKGCVTGRDAFVIDFESEALLGRMRAFVDPSSSDEELIERFKLNPSDWWSVPKARKSMPSVAEFGKFVRPILYRPFDTRSCFYHSSVFMSPRRPVMRNVDQGFDNLILVTSRMTKGEQFRHVTVTRGLAEAILLSSKTSNNAIVFPLYLYPETGGDNRLQLGEARRPNFSDEFIGAIRRALQVPAIDGRGDGRTSVGFDDIFDYMVAILHSPSYRDRYAGHLTRDFPRIHIPNSIELFSALVRLGGELAALHLLEGTPTLSRKPASYGGPDSPQVTRVSWSDETVWLDAAVSKKNEPGKPGTIGFHGVTEGVWNFHIGGYQVCEKWLKDRKGRTLSDDDIAHYQKIIVAISETIRLMKEIDEVIEEHGGWPGAFVTDESGAVA